MSCTKDVYLEMIALFFFYSIKLETQLFFFLFHFFSFISRMVKLSISNNIVNIDSNNDNNDYTSENFCYLFQLEVI